MVAKIVFYMLLALGVPILASIIRSLLNHRYRSAWMTLRVYLIVVAVYTGVVVATTLSLPVEMFPATETLLAGDWTVGIVSMRRIPHDLDEDYELDFRMGNRSKAPITGPKNLDVYLLTEDGTRYNPAPEPSTPPFDTVINPGKYVTTTRKFVLPTNLNRVELVLARRGFRIESFIVGHYPLDGRTVIVLQ